MSYPYYILNDKGEPEGIEDIKDWGAWMETSKRSLKVTNVGDYFVSTVFLGLDYSFGDSKKPILFETMVFEHAIRKEKVFGKEMEYHEPLDEYSARYHTKEEALTDHDRIVEAVKNHTNGNSMKTL